MPSKIDFERLYLAADAAGKEAAEACEPTPMIVGYPTTPLGNDIDTSKASWYVPQGVCGFAWVIVKPGNSAFANWLKKMDYARKDSYYGGVSIWISDYGQSMEKKAAYARGFAGKLQEAGYNAYSMSRMD